MKEEETQTIKYKTLRTNSGLTELTKEHSANIVKYTQGV